MKEKLLLVAIFILSSTYSFAQIEYEPGYFIDTLGNRVECLIKNVDWKNNPTEFDYKETADGAVYTNGITTIMEFGVNGASKFVRAKVQIDKSRNEFDNLSPNRNPEFTEQVLFLRTILEGDATLYKYEEENITRFFFKVKDSDITQLVYKLYLVKSKSGQSDGQIGTNNFFRQQLKNELQCNTKTASLIDNATYYQSDLKKIFVKYNECVDPNFAQSTTIKETKTDFNLTIRPGMSILKTDFTNNAALVPININLGTKKGYRLGIETEFVLPFNKNKWSFIMEPTFQSISYKTENDYVWYYDDNVETELKYTSIEVPIGFRHYFFLGKKSKIFVNASYVLDYPFNSYIKIFYTDNQRENEEKFEIKSNGNFAIGGGYNFNNRFNLEIRYQTNRQLLKQFVFWNSTHNATSIIIGYTLF